MNEIEYMKQILTELEDLRNGFEKLSLDVEMLIHNDSVRNDTNDLINAFYDR
jgi:hypothetical protein